jgi:hypothetical protein
MLAFSLAQAFTPGTQVALIRSSFPLEPLQGLGRPPRLKGPKRKRGIVSLASPGVNAWATEKGMIADNGVSRNAGLG